MAHRTVILHDDHEILRWLRRSRHRRRVLEFLKTNGPSYLATVATALRVPPAVVLAALVGEGKRYAPRRSLVACGLVAVRSRPTLLEPDTVEYAITPLGLRFADAPHVRVVDAPVGALARRRRRKA